MANHSKIGALQLPTQIGLQKRLSHYLQGRRIHPAIILIGVDSETKIRLVKNIAKSFLCKHKTRPFCGNCSPCRRIEKEIYPDVMICRTEATQPIKIDTIRQLCNQMQPSPLEGTSKFCIIDNCHQMNTAAANAFLKSLEEPGENRYYWLLTPKPGALLPTVLSRCVQFHLDPEPQPTQLSDTSVRTYAEAWDQYLKDKDFGVFKNRLKEKEDCLKLIQFLQQQARQTVMGNPNSDESYQSLETFDALVKAEGRLRSNTNYALMMETLLQRHFQS